MGKDGSFLTASIEKTFFVDFWDLETQALHIRAANTVMQLWRTDWLATNWTPVRHMIEPPNQTDFLIKDIYMGGWDGCQSHVGMRILKQALDNMKILNLFNAQHYVLGEIGNIQEGADLLREHNKQLIRIPGPAPQHIQAANKLLEEKLFKPTAHYHHKGKGLENIESGHSAARRQHFKHTSGDPSERSQMCHYCWDYDRKTVCCKDELESQQKQTQYDIQLFLSYGSRQISATRLVGKREVLAQTILGRVRHQVYPIAFKSRGLDETFENAVINALTMANDDAAYRALGQARKSTLVKTHDEKATEYKITVMFITHEPVEEVNRLFMGFKKSTLTVKTVPALRNESEKGGPRKLRGHPFLIGEFIG
jgi:hypothetical protein